MQTTDIAQPLTEQDSSRLTPISILTADTIGATRSQKILKVLFDPRSTYTFTKILPHEGQPFQIEKAKRIAAADEEAHREPMCQALGRWQHFAESSPNPADAKSSFFSGESTRKTPPKRLRLFSPTRARHFGRDFLPTLARDSL